MPKLKNLIDNATLEALEDMSHQLASGPLPPVMVYAKAFQDIATGEFFFLRHHGFKNGGQKRKQDNRPARFLGDALVPDEHFHGWPGDPARGETTGVTLLPYPLEVQ